MTLGGPDMPDENHLEEALLEVARKYGDTTKWPNREAMGRADWLWDEDMEMHIPCCTVIIPAGVGGGLLPAHRCGNGPLVGEEIAAGDCGEHPNSPPKPQVEPEPECICPAECDCQAPDDPSCAGISMACPVHNDYPDRVDECEARVHRNGAF